MLECGRGQPLGYSGVVEGINIVNAENSTTPPHRPKIRCKGEIDKGFPSVEGTEPRLGTPVDQCEAKLCVEGDGFWHRPDGKGHGAYVLNHAGCLL